MDDFSDLSAGEDFDDVPMEVPPEDTGESETGDLQKKRLESSDKPQRLFPTVVEFVEQFLVHAIGYKMSSTPGQGLRWDPNWHQYPMVVYRLIALHEAYEQAFAEGGSAVSSWWVQHFDPHMKVILDGDNGPFHGYDELNISSPPKKLPVTSAEGAPLVAPPPEQ